MIMLSRSIIWLVATLPACASVTGREAPQALPLPPSRTTGSGALSVKLAPIEFHDAWRTTIRVTLRNISHDWLWVQYGGRGFEAVFGFEVKDEQRGVRAGNNCATRSELADAGLYVMLGPDGEYSWDDSLDCFAVDRREPWRVTAHFRQTAAAPDAPPPHAVLWFVGEAMSNAVEYVPAADYPGIPRQ